MDYCARSYRLNSKEELISLSKLFYEFRKWQPNLLYEECTYVWYLYDFGGGKPATHREVRTILFGTNGKHGQADQPDASEKTQFYMYE